MFLTDTDGVVVWRGESLPFGEVFSEDKDPDGDGVEVEQPFRFPGQYEDQETGLYYNYFRDYDPSIGRYIEADPIGLSGGVNIFSYVENRPVNLIDPSGLGSCEEMLINGLIQPEDYLLCLINVNVVSSGPIISAVDCFICIVDCTMPVAGGEVVGDVTVFFLKKMAAKEGIKWATQAIPYVGWVSTAYSGVAGIKCFVKCSKNN